MNEKDFFKPFRKYELDYKRLKRWYLASLYSYDITAKMIDETVPVKNRLDKIYYKESHLIENTPYTLEKKYKKKLCRFLRRNDDNSNYIYFREFFNGCC